MQKKRVIILILVSMLSITVSYAQRAAVTTDLLKWATMSPNISTDIVISSRSSLNLEAAIKPFDYSYFDDVSLRYIYLSPEYRYWFQRPLYSHYVGVNLSGAYYDATFNNDHQVDRFVALGVGYGCSVILARRWSMTPYIGVGCGYFVDEEAFKPMITRLGLSFTYIID